MRIGRFTAVCTAFMFVVLCLSLCALAADGEVDVDFGDIIGNTAYSGTCGENLSWSLGFDGILTVKGEGDMIDFEIGETPWQSHKDNIVSVIIENTVTGIGENAFGGLDIASAKIPGSVTQIGEGAFDTSSDFEIYTNADSFAVEYAFSFSIGVKLIGDLDGTDSVDLDDAILLLQHSMFAEDYPIEDYALSVDLNSDGEVDLDDAILLLQHSMFPEDYPI